MPDPDSSTPPAAAPSARLADALLGIAQRASPLAWRLARGAALPATGEGGDAVEPRLATWCQAVANGDWETFRKRLAWDGLDLDRARAALGPPPLDLARLPAWLDTLLEALVAA